MLNLSSFDESRAKRVPFHNFSMSLVDPTPGALVERYSWEIDTIQRDRQDDTEEFSQVRSELAAERERKAKSKARREEIQRIEAQVSFTR